MLQINSVAPIFSLPGINEDGNDFTFNITDYINKSNIVLYFYPKDDTPGCTTQSCNFKDNLNTLYKYNTKVIGISLDNIASHKKFKNKYNLNFPLLTDENAQVSKLYFSYGPKSFMGKEYTGVIRNTFLINMQGNIKYIWQNVSVANHITEVIEEIIKL